MPMFRYEVVDQKGHTLSGAMDAPSEGALQHRLLSKGYSIKTIVAPSGAVAVVPIRTAKISPQISSVTVPQSELAIFYRAINSYLTSGMTLHQAMAEMAVRTPDQGLREVAGRIGDRVKAGEPLSVCMKDYPWVFPPHVIGLTAAGELGGFLPAVMGDIAQEYELLQRASTRWVRVVNRLLWSTAIANCFLANALPLVFTKGTAAVGGKFSLVGYLHNYLQWTIPHIALPIAGLLLIYYIIITVYGTPQKREFRHRLILKLPGSLRDASKDRSLALFTKTLWRLQAASILPIQAWDAASKTAENVVIAAALQSKTDDIRNGTKFSDAIVSTGYFTDADQRVLSLGEQSGQTDGVLQRMALHYEDAAISSTSRTRWVWLRISIWACVLTTLWFFTSFITCWDKMPDWATWYVEEAP